MDDSTVSPVYQTTDLDRDMSGQGPSNLHLETNVPDDAGGQDTFSQSSNEDPLEDSESNFYNRPRTMTGLSDHPGLQVNQDPFLGIGSPLGSTQPGPAASTLDPALRDMATNMYTEPYVPAIDFDHLGGHESDIVSYYIFETSIVDTCLFTSFNTGSIMPTATSTFQ